VNRAMARAREAFEKFSAKARPKKKIQSGAKIAKKEEGGVPYALSNPRVKRETLEAGRKTCKAQESAKSQNTVEGGGGQMRKGEKITG